MRFSRVVSKIYKLLYFSGLVCTQFFCQHQKSLSNDMTYNGTIILDISFEQRSICTEVYVWLQVRHQFLMLHTYTSPLHHWVNQYWSFFIIFLYPGIQEQHGLSASKWRQQSFLTEPLSKLDEMSSNYLSASQWKMCFQENLQTDFVQWILEKKLLNSFIPGKCLFFAENTFFVWPQT